MPYSTPFFQAFGPLLFGKPPVQSLARALAEFSSHASLGQLRKAFGCYIPHALLSPQCAGDNSRRRVFSLEVVFWSFLDQVQTPNASCREAVRKVMAAARRKAPSSSSRPLSGNNAAYCQARAKLPLEVLDQIHEHLVHRLQSRIPSKTLWYGRHVRLIDGTGASMPDTPENQTLWPQSKGQKPGCCFPSMSLVGVFCLLSGTLLKVAFADRNTHESKLFRRLWEVFQPGDLVVGDRGFCSFGAVAGLFARKVDSLLRLPENRIRKAIAAKLPKRAKFDVTILWKRPAQRPPGMEPEDFDVLPESIPIRVVRYPILKKGFRTQSVTLVTTLLEDTAIPATELAALYFRRWEVELHFREIKIHLNMDVLRCKTPHMIERELRMHWIAYNLVRCVMQKAALTHDVDLGRVSFKGTLDTVRQFANALHGAEDKPRTVSAMVAEMLLAIARDKIPLRPDRTEPRARKRRPKNYRLLTKPRHKMGPLPHRKIGVENPPKTLLT